VPVFGWVCKVEPANLFVIDLADTHGGGTSSYSTSGFWRGWKNCFWSKLIFFSICKLFQD